MGKRIEKDLIGWICATAVGDEKLVCVQVESDSLKEGDQFEEQEESRNTVLKSVLQKGVSGFSLHSFDSVAQHNSQ